MNWYGLLIAMQSALKLWISIVFSEFFPIHCYRKKVAKARKWQYFFVHAPFFKGILNVSFAHAAFPIDFLFLLLFLFSINFYNALFSLWNFIYFYFFLSTNSRELINYFLIRYLFIIFLFFICWFNLLFSLSIRF